MSVICLQYKVEEEGIVYKLLETDEEKKQCYKLYQGSFLKGVISKINIL